MEPASYSYEQQQQQQQHRHSVPSTAYTVQTSSLWPYPSSSSLSSSSSNLFPDGVRQRGPVAAARDGMEGSSTLFPSPNSFVPAGGYTMTTPAPSQSPAPEVDTLLFTSPVSSQTRAPSQIQVAPGTFADAPVAVAAATTGTSTITNEQLTHAFVSSEAKKLASPKARSCSTAQIICGLFLPVLCMFLLYAAVDGLSYYHSLEADHERIGIVTFVDSSLVNTYYARLIDLADLNSHDVSSIRDPVPPSPQVPVATAASPPVAQKDNTPRDASDQVDAYVQQQLHHEILGRYTTVPVTDVSTSENGDQAAVQQPRLSSATVLRHLLMQAPRLGLRGNLLCQSLRQWNPTKSTFHFKRVCMDNLYQNVLLDMFSPIARKQLAVDASRYEPGSPTSEFNKALMDEHRQMLENLSRMSGINRDRHIAALNDCACGEQLGFPDSFVLVCEVKAERGMVSNVIPSCKLYIYPRILDVTQDPEVTPEETIASVDFKLAYVPMEAPSNNYGTHLKSESSSHGPQSEFDSAMDDRLRIDDEGRLYRPQELRVTYYELPSLDEMLFYFNATWASPALAKMRIKKNYQRVFSSRHTDHLFEDLYDSIRSWKVGDDAIEHESIKGVTRLREEVISRWPERHRSFQQRLEVIRKAEQSDAEAKAKQKRGWTQAARDTARDFVSNSHQETPFSCEEFKRAIGTLDELSELHLIRHKNVSRECIQQIFEHPRLAKREATVTGHTANCLLYCSRKTDLLRIDALEFDFLNSVRMSHSTEDFQRARAKLRSADAYVGVYFDKDQ